MNGVGELKGGAYAEMSFCHIEHMTKSCGEKLECETLASASKFIHSLPERVAFRKVGVEDVDRFQYLC